MDHRGARKGWRERTAWRQYRKENASHALENGRARKLGEGALRTWLLRRAAGKRLMDSMPDDPADPCPPDAENNTPDAPAPRPGPLQHSDKADVGCLIFLGVVFVGVFMLPVVLWMGGGVVIVPLFILFQ